MFRIYAEHDFQGGAGWSILKCLVRSDNTNEVAFQF